LIELENGLKGAGRVLKHDEATIFVELYRMNPIKDASQFEYEMASKEKPVRRVWCYEDGLKRGEWEIIDNKPIVGEIEMPYFWTQEAGYGKFLLVKGTDNVWGELTKVEIDKDEVKNYEPYGIADKVAVQKLYINKLREMNML
jgi:hypothetical protein